MVPSLYAPRLRAERLISGGRVVLGASSLFAVWFDPSEPVTYAGVAYVLLVAYVTYASVVASVIWRVRTLWTFWPLTSHIVDLVFFSLFIFFTEGPASPFTTYFVFALVSGTLRWQSKGALWTAVVAFSLFFGLGISRALQYPNFQLHAFIIRLAYMGVMGFLLSYLGSHEHRTLREMWQLASWPHTTPSDVRALTGDLLAYASRLLGASRAMLVWTEPDTPWRQATLWENGEVTHLRQPANEPLLAERVRARAFVTTGGPAQNTIVHDSREPQFATFDGDPLAGEFAKQYGGRETLSAPVVGEGFDGRLFFFDKKEATLDDLLLAEVIADLVSARFQSFLLTEQLRQAAANEERIRLARDLHDGVLQSFTGAALRLKAIQKLMTEDRPSAITGITELQQVLAAEQRELRFFIQELRPLPISNERMLYTLLNDLGDRMEREWGLHVDLAFPHADRRIPEALAREVYLIVREGLMNAARHGAASEAFVTIAERTAETMSVSIVDNGRGFSFVGRYETDELVRQNLGPRTLRERIIAMHGSLSLHSGPEGAELHMVLPATATT